jgi:hypothetical protein
MVLSYKNNKNNINNAQNIMLCYALLSHTMLCHVMPCYLILSYVMLCHAISYYAMSCYAMLSHTMLCHVMPCQRVLLIEATSACRVDTSSLRRNSFSALSCLASARSDCKNTMSSSAFSSLCVRSASCSHRNRCVN